MSDSKNVLTLPSGQIITINFTSETEYLNSLRAGDDVVLENAKFSFQPGTSQLLLLEECDPFGLWVVLFSIFHLYPKTSSVEVATVNSSLSSDIFTSGLIQANSDDRLLCLRSVFYQVHIPSKGPLSGFLLSNSSASSIPTFYVTDKNSAGSTVRHPLRPTHLHTERYARYIPSLQKLLEFHVLQKSDSADVDAFSEWMNNDRVAKFWGMKGAKDTVHVPYIESMEKDRHATQIIGTLDGERFLYTEIYYVLEDHLAPYTDGEVGPYDMGFHLLVGNENLRGPHIVRAWLTSIVHMLFLQDTRTRYVFLEPRADNSKLIGYLLKFGFTKLKEFDFPHKRAALMRIERTTFFEEIGPAL
ncbi:GNAT domain-containing protein [Myxozyma melibiosi]|uniref:GNAT domain-containing protein n=1 Tax=Myxozyma melibiosi TaxID=54550 RepID=A0ABR1FB70_9ASCO